MDPLLNAGLLKLNASDSNNNGLSLDNAGENSEFAEKLNQNIETHTQNSPTQTLPNQASPDAAEGQKSADGMLNQPDDVIIDPLPKLSIDELTQFINDTRQPILYHAVDEDDLDTLEIDLTVVSPDSVKIEPVLFIENIQIDEKACTETEVVEDGFDDDGLIVAFEIPNLVMQDINEMDSQHNQIIDQESLVEIKLDSSDMFSQFSKPVIANISEPSDFNLQNMTLHSELLDNESVRQLNTEGLANVQTELDANLILGMNEQNRANPLLDNASIELENLPTIPVNQNFAENMGERVLWLVKGDIQSAEISLDPPELGPIQIKITIQNQEAKIGFQSNVAEVRDLLNDSVFKLREMLQSEGLSLGDVDISGKDTSQDSQKADTNTPNNKISAEAEPEMQNVSNVVAQKSGLDLFA